MTERIIRQQGAALQKGAATEDRRRRKPHRQRRPPSIRRTAYPSRSWSASPGSCCPRSRHFTSRKRGNGCLRSGRKNAGKRNARRQKSVALWQHFCFRKTDGECRFVVRKTLYLNGAAHSNDQFLGYGKAKTISGGCSGRIALI